MNAFEVILWIVVPTTVYFRRAGLVGSNAYREGQPLTKWFNARNIPFFLLTAVKVFLFWVVAVYMVFKVLTGRSTSSPWTAKATVDGKEVFEVVRTREWGAALTNSGSTAISRSPVHSAAPSTPATPDFAQSYPSPAAPQTSASDLVSRHAVAPEPPVASVLANPEPASTSVATAGAAAGPATSEEEMTREMAYSLAAMCQEASRLYDECIEKADTSEKARAMSQTDYVNGVQQHPISKQSFANMADRMEAELTSLLQELHQLSAKGQRIWDDFMFLAGGPSSDLSTAMLWSAEHGVDSSTVSTLAVQGLFLRCDFGLTKASFLAENDRLNAVLESNKR